LKMKNRLIVLLLAISLVMGLKLPAHAQNHYRVTDLGPLQGGTFSVTNGVNNKGWVSGTSSLSDNTEHAILWRGGVTNDLGTLGGANSAANVGPNQKGQVVGEAETSTPDPNGEDFCGFLAMGFQSTGASCLPFLWQDGAMSALPTLGGNNGDIEQINNRGVAAGVAESSTPDPNCPAPQALQFKPAVWEKGKIQELPTVAGDPDGFAFAVNDSGQVVGGSGICSNPNPFLTFLPIQPVHAVLWEQGTVTDLGNFGGATGNWAIMVNNRGEVVGQSDLAGDTAFHGFLWTRQSGLQDLGTLPGDVASGALAINDGGEVVGVSLDANFNLHAVIWQKGASGPVNLNDLVDEGGGLYLQLAFDINSRGEIVGQAMQTSTGEIHGFLATPDTQSMMCRGKCPLVGNPVLCASEVIVSWR
jgi:probable HAF family extracellular repeat protein